MNKVKEEINKVKFRLDFNKVKVHICFIEFWEERHEF